MTPTQIAAYCGLDLVPMIQVVPLEDRPFVPPSTPPKEKPKIARMF